MDATAPRTQYNLSVPSRSVEVIGRLVSAPEMRYTPQGKAVASFRMAVSRSYQDQQSHEWKEVTAFYRVTVWGDSATRLAERNLIPGDVALVEFNPADLKASAYADKEGKPAASLEITANRVYAMATKAGNREAAAPGGEAPATEENYPF